MCMGAGITREGPLAPSVNIFGSYFPSWMLCALGAIVLTVVVRQIFVAVGLDRVLPKPFVVYLAMAVACSFGAWLLWLG
jgi:YtcA family